MTYEELKFVIDLLTSKGYLEQKKPMWDMDYYQILNSVNKDLDNSKIWQSLKSHGTIKEPTRITKHDLFVKLQN